MSTFALQTHEFIKELTETGFTERQAEIIARHQAKIIEENLATKADIASVRQDIELLSLATKADIASVRQDIELLSLATKADIASVRKEIEMMKKDLILKLGAIIVTGLVATIGIILGVMSMMLK